MISNGFDGDQKDINRAYFKRHNYYVFELYHNHFGSILLKQMLNLLDIQSKDILYHTLQLMLVLIRKRIIYI